MSEASTRNTADGKGGRGKQCSCGTGLDLGTALGSSRAPVNSGHAQGGLVLTSFACLEAHKSGWEQEDWTVPPAEGETTR